MVALLGCIPVMFRRAHYRTCLPKLLNLKLLNLSQCLYLHTKPRLTATYARFRAAANTKFMLALKLFEVGRLSSGKAGKLCGMGRVEFLFAAGRAGVPVVALDGHEF